MIPMGRGLTALIVICGMSIKRTDQPGWGVSFQGASEPGRAGSVVCQVLGSAVQALSLVFLIRTRKLKQRPEDGHHWNQDRTGRNSQVTWILILLVSPLTTLSKHRILWPQCFFTVWAPTFWKLIKFCFNLHLEECSHLDTNMKNAP